MAVSDTAPCGTRRPAGVVMAMFGLLKLTAPALGKLIIKHIKGITIGIIWFSLILLKVCLYQSGIRCNQLLRHGVSANHTSHSEDSDKSQIRVNLLWAGVFYVWLYFISRDVFVFNMFLELVWHCLFILITKQGNDLFAHVAETISFAMSQCITEYIPLLHNIG